MSENTIPVVVKRIKKGGSAAHGGAWKIAYSDFVTAMMAFFLLLWLLGSTSKGDLQGIAEFFQNPLKIARDGGSGSGDATSILQGGGQDLTRAAGQVRKGSNPNDKTTREQRREFEQREKQSLERLKQRIEEMIDKSPELRIFKNQLLLELTAEGLRIQIVDEQNRPMFDLASDQLKPYTVTILHKIAEVLNEVPYRLSLAGYTDAAQFVGGVRGFSNWELSANRANSSRRELVAGGLDDTKVLRVVGLASSVLFNPNDPLSPANRRISITVLNKRTEMAILQENSEDVEVDDDDEQSIQNLADQLP
ncbi:MAG: flagellar motor protein MotB [Zoogloeaceae bacterium]|jgi:chemotaxis protein MotB|nr:flagellar motor protein MotB [Zoogloeaceae bacterium]